MVTIDNIFTRYYDMPNSIKSYVVSNSDGSYTVIINSRHSIETQKLAFIHEITHIKNGDYEKKGKLNLIEINAHNG